MNKEKKIDNRIFIQAFFGVMLLLISVVVGFAEINYINNFRPYYFLVPAITASVSAVLLYKAFKRDKIRFNQAPHQV